MATVDYLASLEDRDFEALQMALTTAELSKGKTDPRVDRIIAKAPKLQSPLTIFRATADGQTDLPGYVLGTSDRSRIREDARALAISIPANTAALELDPGVFILLSSASVRQIPEEPKFYVQPTSLDPQVERFYNKNHGKSGLFTSGPGGGGGAKSEADQEKKPLTKKQKILIAVAVAAVVVAVIIGVHHVRSGKEGPAGLEDGPEKTSSASKPSGKHVPRVLGSKVDPSKLSKKERDAVADYISLGRGHEMINDHLRNGSGDKGTQAKVDHLDSVFAKAGESTRGQTLTRGVSVRPKDVNIGDVLTENGFMSTSTDVNISRNYAEGDGSLLRIRTNEHTRAIPGSTGESELILNRGTSLRVIGKTKDENGYDVIETEVV